MLYLISDSRIEFARVQARKKALGPTEWVFIPWMPDDLRSEKLAGRMADEKHMIGFFTNEERYLLCR